MGSTSAAPTLRSGDTMARLGFFVQGFALHTSHFGYTDLPEAMYRIMGSDSASLLPLYGAMTLSA